jgi:hypothetical protein
VECSVIGRRRFISKDGMEWMNGGTPCGAWKEIGVGKGTLKMEGKRVGGGLGWTTDGRS